MQLAHPSSTHCSSSSQCHNPVGNATQHNANTHHHAAQSLGCPHTTRTRPAVVGTTEPELLCAPLTAGMSTVRSALQYGNAKYTAQGSAGTAAPDSLRLYTDLRGQEWVFWYKCDIMRKRVTLLCVTRMTVDVPTLPPRLQCSRCSTAPGSCWGHTVGRQFPKLLIIPSFWDTSDDASAITWPIRIHALHLQTAACMSGCPPQPHCG